MSHDQGPNLLTALQQIARIFSRALGEVADELGKLPNQTLSLSTVTAAAAPALIEPVAAPPPEVVEAVAPAPDPAPDPWPPSPPQKIPEFNTVEQAAQAVKRSSAFIYGLINKGLVSKHFPFGKALTMVSMEEVKKVVEKHSPGGQRVRTPAPAGRVWAKDAAEELGLSTQSVYNLIKANAFPGASQDDSKRFSIPRNALDEYKRALGLIPFAAPKPEPVAVETAPAAPEPPPVDLEPVIKALEEEVTALEPVLAGMSPSHRACQLAMWAGQARKLTEEQGPVSRRAWTLVHRLEPIASKYGAWVPAVYPTFTFEDWDLYVRANAIERPILSAIEEQVLIEGDLKALLIKSRQVKKELVDLKINQAKSILGEHNMLLSKVQRTFAARFKEEEKNIAPPPPVVAPEVLELTKGKRVLIIGGQGERDAHRESYIEQLQLAECEWATAERNKPQQLNRVLERATPKNFDMLIYLTSFTGHAANNVANAAKKKKLPVVMLNTGYSVAQVAQAIKDQYTAPVSKPAVKKVNKVKNGHSNGHTKNGHAKHA